MVLRRLPKYIYNWTGDYQCLYDLEKYEIADRRYRLPDSVDLEICTDIGILSSHYDKGFEFDGRSGPKILDRWIPNLGNIFERIGWLNHDGTGYATCLDFKSSNRFLKVWLNDQCYGSFKSGLIEAGVSLSDSWYGVPEEGDPWYCNLGKFNLTWKDKI